MLLRSAAILLALATAARLIQMGSDDPRPMSVLFFARAFVIGALLHAGLFFAPEARRVWQLVAVGLSMLPSVLVLLSIAGDSLTRLTRGSPLEPFTTAATVFGLLAYGLALWWLARRPVATT